MPQTVADEALCSIHKLKQLIMIITKMMILMIMLVLIINKITELYSGPYLYVSKASSSKLSVGIYSLPETQWEAEYAPAMILTPNPFPNQNYNSIKNCSLTENPHLSVIWISCPSFYKSKVSNDPHFKLIIHNYRKLCITTGTVLTCWAYFAE